MSICIRPSCYNDNAWKEGKEEYNASVSVHPGQQLANRRVTSHRPHHLRTLPYFLQQLAQQLDRLIRAQQLGAEVTQAVAHCALHLTFLPAFRLNQSPGPETLQLLSLLLDQPVLAAQLRS